jgi:hypothetical protein
MDELNQQRRNSMVICAVVAHFIDKDLHNRSTLIGMSRVKGNIAEAVIVVVEVVLSIGTNEVVSNLGVLTTPPHTTDEINIPDLVIRG